MPNKLFFVTGTSTGVGKTVFAALLTREYRIQGRRVAGLKPVCSGGRQDAVCLWKAASAALKLDEVNPWHFPAALAPLLAARQEGKRLLLRQVAGQIRTVGRGFDFLIVEGAGGLLSPIGEDFDSRDLLLELKATPLIVSANQLGAVNQVRLVLAALPPKPRAAAHIILMNLPRKPLASRSNPALLSEFCPAERIHVLPWLTRREMTHPPARVRKLLQKLLK
ncbi:MAG TPA: dethiobiotin synthase [Clostridia bacterium]|nr:dethiobiotin synthase [Clostridia bacterium]